MLQNDRPMDVIRHERLRGEIRPLDLQGADELVALDLPPIRMVVGDAIPAGLLLLGGDPKTGKSLLLQHLGMCVALGLPAWGSLSVDAGDVLYIAREGGQRSFRERLVTMRPSDPMPSRMKICYDSAQLGSGLEEQIQMFLEAAEDPRLVVIDTYTAVAPETRGVNRHREDYNTMAGLADLANSYPDTLIVVISHTRKDTGGGEDVMQRISGSQGLTAVTDGNAVLSRHTAARQCLLSIRPRNAEESTLVLERDETLRWTVVGEDERSELSGSRQLILDWLDANPDGGGPKEISAQVGLSYDGTRQLLMNMKAARQVTSPKRGLYCPAGVREAHSD